MRWLPTCFERTRHRNSRCGALLPYLCWPLNHVSHCGHVEIKSDVEAPLGIKSKTQGKEAKEKKSSHKSKSKSKDEKKSKSSKSKSSKSSKSSKAR